MYTYNPSFINEATQLQNYLNAQDRETAVNGYRSALGNSPSFETRAAATVAGALTAKLIMDIFDR